MRQFLRLILNKRFRQVFSLFLLFLAQFWWLGKIKRFLSAEVVEARYRELYRRQAVVFTATATQLGGLLIKLGQFFSSRIDILPEEYTAELAKLQDAVTPVATELIIGRIEEQFKHRLEDLFAAFSMTPLASASLGQVHEASLISGEKVAVKVLRPGIEDIVAIDLETLRVITDLAKGFRRLRDTMDLDALYEEFKETTLEELDYQQEAENAHLFRHNLADAQELYAPLIYPDLSTKKVLTMEFIEGIKINEFAALEKAGLDLKVISETLFSSYLKQILVNGFFHADPHPGNIFVRADGSLTFIDFGMMGRVDETMKADMLDLVMAIFKKDASAIIKAFDKLGFLRPHADRALLVKSVRLMLANLFGEVESLRNLDMNEFSSELRELFQSQPFQIPARTLFLGKALGTFMGLCLGLDENFNPTKTIEPYLKGLLGGKLDFSGEGILFDQVKKIALEAISVPGKLNNLVNGLESGEIRLHPAKSFENRLFESQARLSKLIIYAVLASGLMVSGTQLVGGSFQTLGFALLGLGGLTGVSVLLRKSFPTKAVRRPRKMAAGFKKPRMHP